MLLSRASERGVESVLSDIEKIGVEILKKARNDFLLCAFQASRQESDTALWSVWEFPKIRATFLGVLITRTIAFWGLYWVPIQGKYHPFFQRDARSKGIESPSDYQWHIPGSLNLLVDSREEET